ncbi:hypothetical protein KSP40_PGU019099 [Platanthera guangdongensis]|uniref:SWI/SNF-related matrix-associated actin-dependent regulator of chromatin subfamily A member 3-like 3 n=1 Tax=Platanthera guangdongensis TaxID=2320717 RepID=A0ABR2MST8_9ASPA
MFFLPLITKNYTRHERCFPPNWRTRFPIFERTLRAHLPPCFLSNLFFPLLFLSFLRSPFLLPILLVMVFQTPPEPRILLAEEIMSIRLVLGSELPEADILQALAVAGNNPDRAINVLLDAQLWSSKNKRLTEKNVPRELQQDCKKTLLNLEESSTESGPEFSSTPNKAENRMEDRMKREEPVIESNKNPILVPDSEAAETKKDEAMDADQDKTTHDKKESSEESCDNFSMLATAHCSPHINARPITAIPPNSLRKPLPDRKIQVISMPDPVEMRAFPEESDWFLVGRSYVMGLSTARGLNKVAVDEIVYFNFPKVFDRRLHVGKWVSSKAAAATSEIVRFSTKRSGEADFTPEELESRKRSLNLKDDEHVQIEGLAKRRKGDTTYIEQGDDEQAISEASLNKLVGTAEMYNLQKILADAMGLGKTVMTIALILSNPSRAAPDDDNDDAEECNGLDRGVNNSSPVVKGGTLIVCPMALLGQWKVPFLYFVHYGGDKSEDLRELSKHHVVLTTYGVLASAYKSGSEKKSIFHNIRWYRVVLDEAHTIKCTKTRVAQSAFALTSHCRWCLTGTPLQLIQIPYENGDERGLRLIKAILRPLMLRRTKETKDKEGNRGNKQQCADLNNLAQRFLEISHGASPAPAYVEEVVEGIKRGEVSECPICLESASDDPVLTPCAHRMCRECLLASWRTPASGSCPICRRSLKSGDLITCPTENPFEVDIRKNWNESVKVKELVACLEKIRLSGTGEKSIVFSQWTSFLDLLEICFNREGVQFLRFDGKLSQKNREKVLKEFSENSGKEVLLMSLKAGGVGLNLTAASNVFLMLVAVGMLNNIQHGCVKKVRKAKENDPWWNPAVEEQAIMRIHRIGQKRQVKVRRFIVKDTVEDRMQQVQARKQRMIAGALTDEEVRCARIEELKMLFR